MSGHLIPTESDVGSSPPIFEPTEAAELLRGWRLHARKGRERHDHAARYYDNLSITFATLAIIFSAVVGSAAFTQWKAAELKGGETAATTKRDATGADAPAAPNADETAAPAKSSADLFLAEVKTWGPIVIPVAAILSAVLTQLSTTGGWGARAEKHRIAGVQYKVLIRKLEQMGIAHCAPDSARLDELRNDLDKLEMEMPVVSKRIHDIIDDRFARPWFVASMREPAFTPASKFSWPDTVDSG